MVAALLEACASLALMRGKDYGPCVPSPLQRALSAAGATLAMVKAEPFESLVSADARLQELGLQAGDRTASARTIEEVGKAKPELLPLLLKPLQPLKGSASRRITRQ